MTDVPEEARRANEDGVDLADERRYAEAVPFYERARALAPDWWAPHANLGIAWKHTGDFARSLEASRRALALDAEKAGQGTVWNVGVAATALGDWGTARRAWEVFDLPMPEGTGPIDMNLGLGPIRLRAEGAREEVVWCHRIDPARARVESIPTPESKRRYHDVVLNDGEPRGERKLRGLRLPVLDELALLEASSYATWEVALTSPTREDLEALFRSVAEGCDAALEDWSESLTFLCAACSAGTPHEHHEEKEDVWVPERRIAVATRDRGVFERVFAWARAARGRGAGTPECVLEG